MCIHCFKSKRECAVHYKVNQFAMMSKDLIFDYLMVSCGFLLKLFITVKTSRSRKNGDSCLVVRVVHREDKYQILMMSGQEIKLQMKAGPKGSPHNIMHPGPCTMAAKDFHQWNTPNKIQWHWLKICSSAHKQSRTWTCCPWFDAARKKVMTLPPDSSSLRDRRVCVDGRRERGTFSERRLTVHYSAAM